MKKPSLFIASSLEALPIATMIRNKLGSAAEVTLWRDPVFPLTRPALDGIIQLAGRSDFAAVVLSPDDQIGSRGVSWRGPRANVVFELGLFIGELGCERTFVVGDSRIIPNAFSDFRGITLAEYEDVGDSDVLEATIESACARILNAISAIGPRLIDKVPLPSPWADFAAEGFTLVMPRYGGIYGWKDAAGVLGIGDAMALSELRTQFQQWGIVRFQTQYADVIAGDQLQGNIIVIGGPEANKITREALRRAGATLKCRRRVIADQTNGLTYKPSFDGSRVTKDLGVILCCQNPFSEDRKIMALYGTFGYGTWAAARFATSPRFADSYASASLTDDSVECLMEVDVVLDAVQQIRPIVVRPIPPARTR